MTWFAVDDTFHSHPKRLAAGNAAVGVWTACGSFCGQHLTDGHVAGEVARLYGRAADIAALVRVRLWHGPGHDCDRCPQPPPGAYVMHDYLQYNASREEVEAERRRTHEVKSKAGRAGGIASGVTRRRNGQAAETASRNEAETKQEPKQTRSRDEAGAEANAKQRRSRSRSKREAETKQNEAPSPPIPSQQASPTGKLARATHAPASYVITDRHRSWAQQRDIRADLDRETERWLDHHRARGSLFKDWDAAWRTWMSRVHDYAPAARGRPAGDPYLNDIKAGVYEPTDPPSLRMLPALEAR